MISELYRIRRDTKTAMGSIKREYWMGGHWSNRGKFYQRKELIQALKCNQHKCKFLECHDVKIEIEVYPVKLSKVVSLKELREFAK